MKLNRRRLLRCLLGGAALLSILPAVQAAEPRVNLWVELRWVDSRVSQAAVSGVRDGAVVVGTGGSVSPRGAVVLSTEQRQAQGQLLQRLTVLNGYRASVQFGELVPLQWVEVSVPGVSGEGGPPSREHARAQLRQGYVEQLRGFTLEPHWPGGREPVRVTLRAQDLTPSSSGLPGQPGTRTEVESTALVPLDEWVTLARSGGQLQRTERGTFSSRDAESVSSRELQVRIQAAP
jgi:hypothetical protein